MAKTSNDTHFLPLSVVTPSYNQAEYLEACIDSVLSQNYPNLEYVIMDGGSTDNSVEIIKKYDKYLTYWQSQPDGGQYAAINSGFQKTTGEIMTWLNSDDIYHPHAFFIVNAVFMSRQDVEWVTGRSNAINATGEQAWISEYNNRYSRSKYLNKEFSNPWIQQEGTFWRRRLWETSGAGLRTDLEYAGDLELWARFFAITPLYSIDALLAGFRPQPNSKTGRFMREYIKEADKVLDKEIKIFGQESHEHLFSAPRPIELAEINEMVARSCKADPDNAAKHCRQGCYAMVKSGHQVALDFYEQSKKMDLHDHKVRNSLGMLFWQDGEIERAIQEFVTALRINPDFADAVINLGEVLIRINENAKAKKLLSSFLAANPHKKAVLIRYAELNGILDN